MSRLSPLQGVPSPFKNRANSSINGSTIDTRSLGGGSVVIPQKDLIHQSKAEKEVQKLQRLLQIEKERAAEAHRKEEFVSYKVEKASQQAMSIKERKEFDVRQKNEQSMARAQERDAQLKVQRERNFQQKDFVSIIH